MLKVKLVLLTVSFSPLFVNALQLPSYAQNLISQADSGVNTGSNFINYARPQSGGNGATENTPLSLTSEQKKSANPVVGSADLRPNLNASLLKSSDSGKNLLLAQGKGGSINPTQLALAINSYNEIVDTSTPEALAELSKSKDFIEIGQTLRKLRAAFGD